MSKHIDLPYLQQLLFPKGFKIDSSNEYPVFWKRIKQNDTRSKYVFSIVTATMHSHSLRLEGLNESRLRNEIKAGKIVLEKEEDIDKYKETIFETTLDSIGRLEIILEFFEQQIAIIESEPIYSESYKKAIHNIKLLVDAANQTELG
jgi:hypothetical protein